MTPLQTQAGLFSLVLGDEAHAQSEKPAFVEPAKNSQTVSLLQANVSSSSILEEKKEAKINKNSEDKIDEKTSVSIVSDNALLSSTGPMRTSALGVGSGDISFDDISIYVVRKGDTISQVAEMFDVTVDTILSTNDLKKGEKLKEDDVLLILPYSGIEHTVAKGQTLQGIANLYKIDINEILLANDIEIDTKLAVGEKLMIPGANMPSETRPKTGSSIAKRGGSGSLSPNISGYFRHPVPNSRKSRGVTSTHRGVDMAAPTGTPIYASAGGKVLTARMGWNGAYGNMVILQHPNGTKTLYAHMSRLGTSTGKQVAQGSVIGYVGSTGRSTGPHLHFEVLGAKNPF